MLALFSLNSHPIPCVWRSLKFILFVAEKDLLLLWIRVVGRTLKVYLAYIGKYVSPSWHGMLPCDSNVTCVIYSNIFNWTIITVISLNLLPSTLCFLRLFIFSGFEKQLFCRYKEIFVWNHGRLAQLRAFITFLPNIPPKGGFSEKLKTDASLFQSMPSFGKRRPSWSCFRRSLDGCSGGGAIGV